MANTANTQFMCNNVLNEENCPWDSLKVFAEGVFKKDIDLCKFSDLIIQYRATENNGKFEGKSKERLLQHYETLF